MQGKTKRLSVLFVCFTSLLLHKKLYCQQKNVIFPLQKKQIKHGIFDTMKKDFDYRGSIILGMHDAIVSLTGLIAGLGFTLIGRDIIILSCIISSITASLSMGAANYLAVKTVDKNHAIHAALYTAGAYMTTCVLLILPFFVIYNRNTALLFVFFIVILIIYFFNFIFFRHNQFYKHFYEMLTICSCVSVMAFAIGQCAKYFLGV